MNRIAIIAVVIVVVAVIVRALPGNVESGEPNDIRLTMIVPAIARAW